MSLSDLVTDLVSRGRYHFTTDEAVAALGSSVIATRAALRRFREKGHIAVPYRGFHVIVPPEYRRLGCLPADQFISHLMEYLKQPYYVALLIAARYHGAAHHQPQMFHVMVPKNRGPITCGKVRVRFVARRNIAEMPTARFNTPRGYVRVSSPEATAFDLVGYYEHAGGLDNVATVLSELVELIDSEKLAAIAKRSPKPWAQRLGYLLDLVGAKEKTEPLALYVKKTVTETCSLVTKIKNKKAFFDPRWKLAVNTHVEPEL